MKLFQNNGIFSGVYTALITPFCENGKVDYKALQTLVKIQQDSDVNGVVACGTTGESATLSHDEKIKIIKFIRNECSFTKKIIVATGCNDTAKTVKFSMDVEHLDINGLLVISPYYNKPTQNGLYYHFMELDKNVSTPIILYNIFGRTSVNIEIETLHKILKDSNNVLGIKESNGNIQNIMQLCYYKRKYELFKNFSILSGDDNLTYVTLALGGSGVISVISNILPNAIAKLVFYYFNGNAQLALELHNILMPLCNALMSYGTNPMSIKYLLSKASHNILNKLRLPMDELSDEDGELIVKIYNEVNHCVNML